MVLLIIGVIWLFVSGSFSVGGFRTRAFYDELISQVQYARKAAIAQRRPVCVHVGMAQSQLFYANASGSACPAATGVAAPTGEIPFTLTVPSGVGVSAATFQFDGLGRYRTAAGAPAPGPLALSVTGEVSYQVLVEHETGYVR